MDGYSKSGEACSLHGSRLERGNSKKSCFSRNPRSGYGPWPASHHEGGDRRIASIAGWFHGLRSAYAVVAAARIGVTLCVLCSHFTATSTLQGGWCRMDAPTEPFNQRASAP